MKFPFEKNVSSEKETKEVVNELAEVVEAGSVITLDGNLGTGKTFIVKEFCRINNIEDADSPTFSIVNEYSGDKTIYHFDFYRIERTEELYDIGIDEYLNDETAVKLIEWAELIQEVIPSKRYSVKIQFIDEQSRNIKIDKHE